MRPEPKKTWPPRLARVPLAAYDVHVFRAALDVSDAVLCRLWSSLPADERCRAQRLCFERDRKRFTAAHGMLRAVLADYLEVNAGDVRFTYGPFGKPALADNDAVRFNLAHSHGLALLAVCTGRDVGVDLESIRPLPDAEQLGASCFSERERRDLRLLPPPHRLDAFFNAWTRKEAFIKATGEGLSRPLDDFDVSIMPGHPAALLRVGADPDEAGRWSIVALKPAPDYVAAVVVEGRLGAVSCWTWGEEDACARVVGVRFENLRRL